MIAPGMSDRELNQGMVYVRQVNTPDKGVVYYIGQTSSAFVRYSKPQRAEIFYYEPIGTTIDRVRREAELLCEFLAARLPVLNKAIPTCTN